MPDLVTSDGVRSAVEVAGPDDALRPSRCCERLPHATAVDLPGDHIGAAAAPEFTDAIIERTTA